MESMRLRIGTLTAGLSTLTVYVSVWEDPVGHLSGMLHLSCSETNRDRGGYMILNHEEVARVQELISEGAAKIAALSRTGKLVFMANGLNDQ